jgi:hypothetical protein
MPNQPPRDWRRQLATAFQDMLLRHQELRVLWLATIAEMVRTSPREVSFPPEDEARLHDLDCRLPRDTNERLTLLAQGLERLAPEVLQIAPRPMLDLALMQALLNVASGKCTNSLKPWEPRGRPRGKVYFANRQEFRDVVVKLIRLCEAKRLNPTKARIAAWLKLRLNMVDADNHDFSSKATDRSTASTLKLFYRYCKDFGFTWEELLRAARTGE